VTREILVSVNIYQILSLYKGSVVVKKSNSMKLRSHAAVVKSMKAYKKKSSQKPGEAIVKKLKEIKKTSKNTEREGKLILFRHLHF